MGTLRMTGDWSMIESEIHTFSARPRRSWQPWQPRQDRPNRLQWQARASSRNIGAQEKKQYFKTVLNLNFFSGSCNEGRNQHRAHSLFYPRRIHFEAWWESISDLFLVLACVWTFTLHGIALWKLVPWRVVSRLLVPNNWSPDNRSPTNGPKITRPTTTCPMTIGVMSIGPMTIGPRQLVLQQLVPLQLVPNNWSPTTGPPTISKVPKKQYPNNWSPNN